MTNSDRKTGPGAIYGMLEVMILKTLEDEGPLHGLQIARLLENRSREVLSVEEGALYPALHRLRSQGLIRGEWRISDKRRRAHFYEITKAGVRALRQAIEEWRRHSSAVNWVLALEKPGR